jgi:hypothetical protein
MELNASNCKRGGCSDVLGICKKDRGEAQITLSEISCKNSEASHGDNGEARRHS